MKHIFRVILAEDFDEQQIPTNIIGVCYCKTNNDAEKIAHFFQETNKFDGAVSIIEKIELTTFDEVFNLYMQCSYGKNFDDQIIN